MVAPLWERAPYVPRSPRTVCVCYNTHNGQQLQDLPISPTTLWIISMSAQAGLSDQQWFMHLRQLGQLVEEGSKYASRQWRARQGEPPTCWYPDGESAIDLHANFGIGDGASVVNKEARMNAALAVGGVFMCQDRMMKLLCMQGGCPGLHCAKCNGECNVDHSRLPLSNNKSACCGEAVAGCPTNCELGARLEQIDGILSGFGVFAEPAIGYICPECQVSCLLGPQAADGIKRSCCHNKPVDRNMARKRMLDSRLAHLNAAAVAITGHIIIRHTDAMGRKVIDPVRRATVGEVAAVLGLALAPDDALTHRPAAPDRMFWPLTTLTVLMGAVHYPQFIEFCQSGPGSIPSRWAAFKSIETKLDALCCSLSPGDGAVAVGGAIAVWQALSYVCSDAIVAYKGCVSDGLNDARQLVVTYPNLFPPPPQDPTADEVQGGAGRARRRTRRRMTNLP